MFENYFAKKKIILQPYLNLDVTRSKYHNIIISFKSNNKRPNYTSFSRNYS